MKLRINKQSIRFRLSTNEFETLKKYGAISEMLSLGLGEDDCFFYRLAVTASENIGIINDASGLTIAIPLQMINQWDTSNPEAGLSAEINVLAGTLNILIEVDLPCKHV